MKTYSMDLRQRVIAACDSKTESRAQTAQRFNVSASWVKKLLRLRRTLGSFAARPHGGGREAKFMGESLLRLQKLVEEKADASLHELLDASGVKASIMAVARALERLDYRFKKSPYGRRSKSAPMSKRGVKSGAKKRSSSAQAV
jgi:transposase